MCLSYRLESSTVCICVSLMICTKGEDSVPGPDGGPEQAGGGQHGQGHQDGGGVLQVRECIESKAFFVISSFAETTVRRISSNYWDRGMVNNIISNRCINSNEININCSRGYQLSHLNLQIHSRQSL